jgi:hypothetical protein
LQKASKILLLGARAPVALELCRSFVQQNNQVFLADMLRFPIARWARQAATYRRIPAPRQAFGAFREALLQLIEQYKIEHLIPTCEETFYVSQLKAELPCVVWTSGFSLLQRLHHKQTFLDLAAGFFHIPKTVSCLDFQDWRNAQAYVFKPVFSRFGSKVIIGQVEEKCRAPRENPAGWIAQERLWGTEICVYSIWRAGDLRGFAAYCPKYRVGSGASVYFEPYFDEALSDAVRRFGQAQQFHGQLSFDLMQVGGQLYALECNPRSTSGAHLLAENLADCFLGDTVHICRTAKAKALKTAWLLTQPQHLFQADFWSSQDVIGSRRDGLPFCLQGLSLLELSWVALRYGLSLTEASTRDIEFNGLTNDSGKE